MNGENPGLVYTGVSYLNIWNDSYLTAKNWGLRFLRFWKIVYTK